MTDDQRDEKMPGQTPEGALIAEALARRVPKMSQREAARRSELSETRWRQIVAGYQQLANGVRAPVVAPADTLARMASVVGVTADELRAVAREDAAEVLNTLGQAPQSTVLRPPHRVAHAVRMAVTEGSGFTPGPLTDTEALRARLTEQGRRVAARAAELDISRERLRDAREQLDEANRMEARDAAMYEQEVARLHELEIEYAVAADRLRRERPS